MSKLCPFCKKGIKDEETCPHCHRVIIEKFEQTSKRYETNNRENQHKKTSKWLNKPFKITKGWVIGSLILVALVYFIPKLNTQITTQQLGQETTQPEPPVDYRELINNDNILIKLNEARLANGLPQLKVFDSLKEYASARANEINLSSNLMHDTILKFENYDNQLSERGEILFSGAQNASQAVNGWLNSPTHRDLILSKDFDVIAVSIIQSNPKLGSIIVAEFGKVYVPPPRQPIRRIQLSPIRIPRSVTCYTRPDGFGGFRTTCY